MKTTRENCITFIKLPPQKRGVKMLGEVEITMRKEKKDRKTEKKERKRGQKELS